MSAGDVKRAVVGWQAITISLGGLASSSTFLAGRESTLFDFTVNKPLDALLSVEKITTGTTPTAGEIRVYVAALVGAAVWPDVLDGTDSAETITSVQILDAIAVLACRIVMPSTSSNLPYSHRPVPIAALFGGALPDKIVVFVAHSTVAALNATGGNHVINIEEVYETVAAA